MTFVGNVAAKGVEFQSTPPRREMTFVLVPVRVRDSISIHTSPKGDDAAAVLKLTRRDHFNPHLPEGR